MLFPACRTMLEIENAETFQQLQAESIMQNCVYETAKNVSRRF